MQAMWMVMVTKAGQTAAALSLALAVGERLAAGAIHARGGSALGRLYRLRAFPIGR
jgi:hypothetical protein